MKKRRERRIDWYQDEKDTRKREREKRNIKSRRRKRIRESGKARTGKTIRTRCTVVINVTAEGFARKCCSVKICNLARKDGGGNDGWKRRMGGWDVEDCFLSDCEISGALLFALLPLPRGRP